jgi:hypothetical protein
LTTSKIRVIILVLLLYRMRTITAIDADIKRDCGTM